jgi:hypothetical protein
VSRNDSNRQILSRKELARELRRQAYRAAKERRAKDPRYIAMKQAAKERRREAYKKAKEQKRAALVKQVAEQKKTRADEQTAERAAKDAELLSMIWWPTKRSHDVN